MPAGMKRKATLSADLTLEALASLAETSQVPTEGNENPGPNEDDETVDISEEDHPQQGPSQRNPRSRSRAERKKMKHLPHHDKLLSP